MDQLDAGTDNHKKKNLFWLKKFDFSLPIFNFAIFVSTWDTTRLLVS